MVGDDKVKHPLAQVEDGVGHLGVQDRAWVSKPLPTPAAIAIDSLVCNTKAQRSHDCIHMVMIAQSCLS